MKTIEQRLEQIEEKLGITNYPTYPWRITINDSYRTFSYEINGRGNVSISEVADVAANFLGGTKRSIR
jgi:hypothetical protein